MNYISQRYPEVFTKPWLWSGYFKDFHSDEELTEFVATAKSSGTNVIIDYTYGKARLSGAATTDNSGSELQYDGESIALKTSKITIFTTSLIINETTSTNAATESDIYAGICITDTDLIGGFTDGVFFRKDDGDTYLDCVIRRDSVDSVATAVTTLATGVDYNLEIVIIMSSTAGTGTAYFYVNGAEVAKLTSTTMPYETEEYLTSSITFQTGDNTGTKYCDFDYVGAWTQR